MKIKERYVFLVCTECSNRNYTTHKRQKAVYKLAKKKKDPQLRSMDYGDLHDVTPLALAHQLMTQIMQSPPWSLGHPKRGPKSQNKSYMGSRGAGCGFF